MLKYRVFVAAEPLRPVSLCRQTNVVSANSLSVWLSVCASFDNLLPIKEAPSGLWKVAMDPWWQMDEWIDAVKTGRLWSRCTQNSFTTSVFWSVMSDPNKSQSQTRPNTKHRLEHLLSEASSAPGERQAKERLEQKKEGKKTPRDYHSTGRFEQSEKKRVLA